MPTDKAKADLPQGRYLLLLSLTALGIVYGDIGTSPLYALRECFYGEHALPVSRVNVFGILSLVFWSLFTIISVKYISFILRADIEGEGGILALTALVSSARRASGKRSIVLILGLFGASLLYGDGMITPAISVLSAVEGLHVATPFFEPFVVPLTVALLIALFLFQSRGTARVGAVFGPVMLVWMLAMAVLGAVQIAREPAVLLAVSPHHAVRFFMVNRWAAVLVLGAVFLVVTGGEALYADIGHFGARPIRLAWFCLVLPALLLNYFGQGALLLRMPEAAASPFYYMAPRWALYPLVLLATAAAIIASQAVISGAFSLTMQAIHLGYCPRLHVEHTSAEEKGQIFLPLINWILMLACIALVLGFKSSSQLAAAYGMAVTATMVITTILFFVLARERWQWPAARAGLLVAFFLAIELAFFAANVTKISHGGWFPLLVAAAAFTLMTTWERGRQMVSDRIRNDALPMEMFIADARTRADARVPGTAIFFYWNQQGTPQALLHNVKHNKVLHKNIIVLTVVTEDLPRVPPAQRIGQEDLGDGFYRLVFHFGYMEDPNVPETLKGVTLPGVKLDPLHVSYFLGRQTLVTSRRHRSMMVWRGRLFTWMARNARNASTYFSLPANRVVEVGTRVEL